MQNGIYRLKYETTTLNSVGVVTLRDEMLSGCDRFYFIVGRYARQGNKFSGCATFRRRAETPGARERGIPERFRIEFSGLASDKFGQFDVRSPDAPVIKGHATFAWLSGVG